MNRRPSGPRTLAVRLVGCAWLLTFAVGCSEKRPPAAAATDCDPPGLAFRIQLAAPAGDLPDGTRLVVVYMGNQRKVFPPRGGSDDNEDVCCRLTERQEPPYPATECGGDLDQGETEPSAILCDVWSNGAAQVSATARGWTLPEQQLEAEWDPDCEQVETQHISLVLSPSDAGAPD